MSIVAGQEARPGDLNEMLRLLSNREEFQERLAKFEQARAAAQAIVALAGPASEILALREAAAADRTKAADELAAARADCDSMRANTAREVQQVRAEADHLRSSAEQAAGIARAEAARLRAEAGAVMEQAVATRTAATEAEAVALAKSTAMDEQRASLQLEREALAARVAALRVGVTQAMQTLNSVRE